MSELLGIRLKTITIMETSKSGKRVRHPQHRTIGGIVTKMSTADASGMMQLTAEVNTRQFSAKLAGTLNKVTGDITVNVVEERTSSYLMKKRFRVMGYAVDGRITNTKKKGAQA